MMSNLASVKVEKGVGTKLSMNTKMDRRQGPGTSTYPQPIKFEGRCEDLKGFIFDCSGGYNTGEY